MKIRNDNLTGQISPVLNNNKSVKEQLKVYFRQL